MNIRNVVILGNLQSGKTTLTEALYATSKEIQKGNVEQGTTISDYLLEEKNHKSSIRSSIIPLVYNDHKINIIDNPGNDEFITDTMSSISVVKGAVLVIDSKKGVEEGTIRYWNMLRRRNIPTLIFVNKMDKQGVVFEDVLEEIRQKLGKKAVPFSYPMGHDDGFDGFINVVTLKARKYNGKTCDDCEIYPDKRAKAFELHNTVCEAVASTSDEMLEKFFSGEELTRDEIRNGLKIAVQGGELIPILVGSGKNNIGIHTLLDMIIDYLPSPQNLNPIEGISDKEELVERRTLDEEPFSAFIFKVNVDQYNGITSIFKVNSGTLSVGDTVLIASSKKKFVVNQLFSILGSTLTPTKTIYAGDIGCIIKNEDLINSETICSPKDIVTYERIEYPTAVYYKALKLKSKQDDEKIGSILAKLCVEDPSIVIKRNIETDQLCIGTLGISHLQYLLERIKNSYKIELSTEDLKIVYRETIKKKAQAKGSYIKQSGGSGFYGVVEMSFEPSEENFFTEEVFGGAIPKNYFPAIEEGFKEATNKGLLAGFPVIGVHATLLDGKTHSVDSNDLAFKMASILAFKEAYMHCNPIILEPIIKMTVTVNEDIVGSILSDLNQRRARVIGMDVNSSGNQKISVLVPESEILEYSNVLKALTKGSGYFIREFYSYEPLPLYLQDSLLKTLKK